MAQRHRASPRASPSDAESRGAASEVAVLFEVLQRAGISIHQPDGQDPRQQQQVLLIKVLLRGQKNITLTFHERESVCLSVYLSSYLST